ncbi:G-protein coupled receptor family C group 6 member A-like [Gastrophryne carolinensis]
MFDFSQLLDQLKNISFLYNGEHYNFSSSGELLWEYDVLNWQSVNDTNEFMTVGNYNTMDNSFFINKSLIQWNTFDNQVPFSDCTPSCLPGFYKKHSNISCCFECIECPENHYTPDTDMDQCLKCNASQWSRNGSSGCMERTKDYFRWRDNFAITLVTFAAFGALLVLVSGCLFLINADTPAVRAAGGIYSYLFMISLLCSLASIGLFIGEPNDIICKIRQPLYGISFTVSVSCILIKSIRILLAFEFAIRRQRVGKLTYQPIATIVVLTFIQLIICLPWIFLKGPYFNQIYTNPQVIILSCDEGSYVLFGLMLGYIGLLALVCFLIAFRGRKLPQIYRETHFITFSMLVYMFVWILFIPIYVTTTTGVYPSVIEAVAILVSVYGVISCHLLPVCYVIIFKKDTCTREQYLQSVQKFYRSKKTELPDNQEMQESSASTSIPDSESFLVPPRCLLCSPIIRKRHKSC